MKYCIDLQKTSILDDVDEITIDYDRKNLNIIKYIQERPQKRFILNILDLAESLEYKDIEKLNAIYEENSDINFAIKLPMYYEMLDELLPTLKVPFFFQKVVTNWEDFLGYISLGVSDIYIGEDLGFELDKVSKIAKEHNIQIRTFPNIVQTQWKYTSSLKSFFIRPEDVELYEQYIDVLEFWGDRHKQPTFYKIYAIDKKWYGDLQEIITGFSAKLDSKFTIPRFSEKRVRCGRSCLKGGICQLCDRIEELSKTLEKADIVVDYKKKKEDEVNG